MVMCTSSIPPTSWISPSSWKWPSLIKSCRERRDLCRLVEESDGVHSPRRANCVFDLRLEMESDWRWRLLTSWFHVFEISNSLEDVESRSSLVNRLPCMLVNVSAPTFERPDDFRLELVRRHADSEDTRSSIIVVTYLTVLAGFVMIEDASLTLSTYELMKHRRIVLNRIKCLLRSVTTPFALGRVVRIKSVRTTHPNQSLQVRLLSQIVCRGFV